MAETGIGRFPGSLDPRAQEFRPGNSSHGTIFGPTQVSYPDACSYSPSVGVQPMPFCGGAAVGVPYGAQFAAPPAYVGTPALVAPSSVPASSSPSRSLLLVSVPSDLVSESGLRRELEVFGDVRGVQMERLRDGIVTVHFYDIRHAEMALSAIRNQHMQQQTRLRNHYAYMCNSWNSLSQPEIYATAPQPPPARGLIAGRAVWAQFIVPAYHAVPDGQNQGTIILFNLDSEVSPESLREICEAFGPVKELRETPSKKNQRFVEFFDIRDAAKALKEMNGKEIHGKSVVIEFSRPGGHSRKFFNAASTISDKNAYHTKSFNFPPPPPPLPLPRKYTRRFALDLPSRSHLPATQLTSTKKSSVNKGSPNVEKSANSACIETAMATMNLNEAAGNVNAVEEKLCDGSAKKNSIKNNSSQSTVGSVNQQQPKSRNWKGKQGKKLETRFLIKEDAIVETRCRDSRTTVMIKNIPNKYSQKLLLNMLDNHCIHCNEQIADGDDRPLSSYDFVYLPIDFNNKCNVGYGFVNMTSPEATLRLYKAFHLQHWEVFNSRKICEVTYARVQGLEALKEHFKNSKFPCEMDHYLPVVFSPPRDGRQLTEPLPIVGHKENQPIPISISNPLTDGDDRPGVSVSDQHDLLSRSSSCGSGCVDADDEKDKDD